MFEPSTDYTVRLPAFKDLYGNSLPAQDLVVKTAALGASVSMPEGVLILDGAASRAFTVTTRNVASGKLRKYGRPVATFDDTSVTFGKRVYTFAFEDAGDWHGFPSWKVTVKRGDTVVIESKQASALCAGAEAKARTGKALPEADQMAEIRRRIMFYLAWREVGA